MYLAFVVPQILLCAWFGRLLLRRGLGLYLLFYLVFLVLIAIPFFLLAAHANQLIDLEWLFGLSPEARVSLDFGNGYRPLTISILFQALYLLGGYLCDKRNLLAGEEHIGVKGSAGHMIRFSILLAVFATGYILLRYYFVPDFPIFRYLAGISADTPIRDISYNYIIRTDIPYLFRPSIHSQFYRLALPLATLVLANALYHYPELRRTKYLVLLGVLVSFTLFMSLGTFKRSPILYLLVWTFCYFYMYRRPRNFRQIAWFGAIAIAVPALITLFYGYETHLEAFRMLARRLMVVEAIGEFLAVEHFGTTFDYLGFDIGQRYLDKLLGHDVQTFSEYWKIATGGSRGFTSIGIMSELFASFSYLALIFYLLIGYLIRLIDLYMYRFRDSDYRPFIAGLMCVVSFVAVKGLFSQLFTGGILALLLALYCYRLSQKFTLKAGIFSG